MPRRPTVRTPGRWGAAVLAPLLFGCGAIDPAPPAGPPAAPLPARPARIVSINPCADLILWAVAEDAQIRAVSHWSHDPNAASAPVAWARRFRATGGSAEEVLALQPDLVLAGAHTGRETAAALRRLGVPILSLPVPATPEEAAAQVEEVGRAIGQARRGRAAAARLRLALAGHRRADGPPVDGLVWQSGGLVPGAGTIADALLAHTGHRNMAAAHGIPAWGVLGLERLIADPPRVIYAGEARARDRVLGHPAVAGLTARVAFVPFPQRLLNCAGPNIAEAAGRMAAGRDRAATAGRHGA